ncbi:hypothetical protein AAVH_06912 [Aphelenchoides avenae]|nr:hypothetical protein AAVH_06912 [Aphelenchus avenae]
MAPSAYFPITNGELPAAGMRFMRTAQKKRDPLLVGKKYDRNCFFSPVQCMLSFKNTNDDAIWSGRGRRKK